MDITTFSKTSIVKELDIALLYDYVQIPNPYKTLPSIQELLDEIIEISNQVSRNNSIKLYHSNAVIGDNNLDNKAVIIPKFHIEVLYNDMLINDGSFLKAVYTFHYNSYNSIQYNIAFVEHILICENGTYNLKNIVALNNRLQSLSVFKDLLCILHREDNIKKYLYHCKDNYDRLSSKIISTEKELYVLGDMLRKSHSKDHILDVSLVSETARYGLDKNNPFKAKDGYRSLYDFMQDFTYCMKTTEISSHITKHNNLSKYFNKLAQRVE